MLARFGLTLLSPSAGVEGNALLLPVSGSDGAEPSSYEDAARQRILPCKFLRLSLFIAATVISSSLLPAEQASLEAARPAAAGAGKAAAPFDTFKPAVEISTLKRALTSNVTPSENKRSVLGIPSLDEMAGDWIPMKDVENPPSIQNFNGIVLFYRDKDSGFDLTSFTSGNPPELHSAANVLWHDSANKVYPTIRLLIDGKIYPAVDCRWSAYRALRRNLECNGLAVETDLRMVNEQYGILLRISVSNTGSSDRRTTLSLEVPGELQPDGIAALTYFASKKNNPERKVSHVTASVPSRAPDATCIKDGKIYWNWTVNIPPGGCKVLEFSSGHGSVKDRDQILARVSGWAGEFGARFNDCKKNWAQRWVDAFTPGNPHFSGHLPVLITDNAALRRNYYMGALTLLCLERTQCALHPRCFITQGERFEGTHFLWDASLHATSWALLEPEGMKSVLRRYLVQNPRSTVTIDLMKKQGYDAKQYQEWGAGYSFHSSIVTKATLEYLQVTRDLSFLDERLENGKTVLEQLDDIANDWKSLVLPDSPLASYGENPNLLECCPDYIHRVPSLNAQAVWIMRQVALLHELHNNPVRAGALREEAARLLPAVLALYKDGDGVWYGLHKDGKRAELRHVVDYVYVGRALADDLTPTMRKEMTEFVRRELLTRDWMRAMSLQDAAALYSDRPDHGPLGCFDGWIPMTVETMWRLGYPREAFDFYCRSSEVTKEGPYVQAHEFFGPDRKAFDAPVRMAYRGGCLGASAGGVAMTDVVLVAFFGFSPSLDGTSLIRDPRMPRPFQGTLTGLRYRGQLYQLQASDHGIQVTGKPIDKRM